MSIPVAWRVIKSCCVGACFIPTLHPGVLRNRRKTLLRQTSNVCQRTTQRPWVPGPVVVCHTDRKQTDGASRILRALGYKKMQQSDKKKNWGIGAGQKDWGEQVLHSSLCLYVIKNICILTWNNSSGCIHVFLPLQFYPNVPVPLWHMLQSCCETSHFLKCLKIAGGQDMQWLNTHHLGLTPKEM